MTRGSVMVAAGGTGGHLFPAQALGEEMIRRGYEVDLITDTRGNAFGGDFPARKIYKVPAATFRGDRLSRRQKRLGCSATASRLRIRSWAKPHPKAIIGFGGYPTLGAASCRDGQGHSDRYP